MKCKQGIALPKSGSESSIELKLLLSEFETAWDQIVAIDNRRGTYFNYFNIALFGVVAITLKFDAPPSHLARLLMLSCVYVALIIMGCLVMKILAREQEASTRYKRKINLIRDMFLCDSEQEGIQYYMEQRCIGLKRYNEDGDGIDCEKGKTINAMKLLIFVEIAFIVLLIFIAWMSYFWLLSCHTTCPPTW